MYCVITLSFGNEPPTQDERSAQREFLAKLAAEDVLVCAGQFADGAGGLSLLRSESLDEARQRFADSPLARSGRIEWQAREWTPTWGLRRLEPDVPTLPA